MVKNGEFYIDRFIRHYTRMGFRHIIFLDNGSTDQTIGIARQHANTSICSSTLPIEAHQGMFKAFLARSYTAGGWCLDADIDEFFDYPFSDRVNLREFLRYLNQTKATAVTTQLLDMFSDKPLSKLAGVSRLELSEEYPYYRLSEITRISYQNAEIVNRYGAANRLTSESTALLFGGIRKILYGNNCLLTKHSLFVPTTTVELFPHSHFVNNATIADISCLMLHYKFIANALELAVQNADGFIGNRKGYRDFIRFLQNGSQCGMSYQDAQRYESADQLVESGFIFVSDRYWQFAHAKESEVTQ